MKRFSWWVICPKNVQNAKFFCIREIPGITFHCCRFVGGELNTCYNAVDRHVAEGNGGQVAIIYDSPVTKQIKKISYRELWEEVSFKSAILAVRLLVIKPLQLKCPVV